ncbi:ketopantoate reductase family protein [Futiania mangrovi]|uniref:2-dehydropantoate 2-reductase n=1 Tax=Futiania mangrovi TaxID=2959716 RepID=A0A9J6P800_9PROT|nr:2-dehydropantoate 2-reductase [Futiania mangrovii]MCP1335540.1 2-dehydropantoate 2-reductase [Futiania mangrovii]
MRIAVMGAGALGGYFGGRLQASGADVTFIARGAHLEAMQRNGLRIESPLGDLHLAKVMATGDPAEVGPVDIVLFLVKLQDTRTAARAIAPLIGPSTGVLSLQNGVEAWTWIGEDVGAEHVIGGTALIPADVREPGVVRHSAPFAKLTFGEFGGAQTDRCTKLLGLLEAAGIEATLVSDIEVKIWEKFVALSAFSALTTLTRLPIGPVRSNPECRELLRRAIEETLAVGQKACPGLSGMLGQGVLDFFDNAPPGMRSSMLDDLNRGKPIEVEYLSGAVARLAPTFGLSAPTHDMVARALAPFRSGPPEV